LFSSKDAPPPYTGDRWFESISLQERVRSELDLAEREPAILPDCIPAPGIASGSQEQRRTIAFQVKQQGGNEAALARIRTKISQCLPGHDQPEETMPSALEEKDAIRKVAGRILFSARRRLSRRDGRAVRRGRQLAHRLRQGDGPRGNRRSRAQPAGAGWPAAVPRDPSGDQHRDRARWRERAGALKLDSRARTNETPF
jgi:hypothetical protein